MHFYKSMCKFASYKKQIDTPLMNIVINPTYSQFTHFVEELPTEFATNGELIYKSRNEIRKYKAHGIEVAVKRYKVPVFVNRIVYGCFRPTKAERSYSYALKLEELGIGTPAPIAYSESYCSGLLGTCYFVSVMESHEYTMRVFEHATLTEDMLALLYAFAQYTVMLHEKGVHHRDYSPGNILFTKEGEKYHFCLVDINRMQFGKLSRKACLHNFHRICRQDVVVRQLVTYYATLRGWEVESAVKEALRYRAKVLKRKQCKKRFKELFRKKKD